MGIETDIANDWHAALAALAWQVDLGVADIIGEAPLDRYDLPEPVKRPDPVALPPMAAPPRIAVDAPAPAEVALAVATQAAAAASSLADLCEALVRFEHCEFKRGARNLVFADGNPKARVLILGEAPGVEEDREGRPFVGPAGQMLDRMFEAIGLSRQSADPETALYITNVLPWRPPHRDPSPEEIAMMRPFVTRHVELIDPEFVVVMGNTSMQAALNTTGILRHRGTWAQGFGKPVLPMAHPAYLMRVPEAKREAWADLLSLKARLRG
jgi:uracil-DNA glycosylase